VFAADAFADPVAGLAAAAGVLAGLVGGGGLHVDVALREAVGSLLGARPLLPAADLAAERDGPSRWRVRQPAGGNSGGSGGKGGEGRSGSSGSSGGSRVGGDAVQEVLSPRQRLPTGRAAPLGAHTVEVLAALDGPGGLSALAYGDDAVPSGWPPC
jgi:hypothetical protein